MVSPRHIVDLLRQRSSAWLAERALERRIQRPRKGPAGRDSERVLFFAPEGGLAPHFHMLCVAAKTLQERGHQVWLATCFKNFSRCPVMAAHRTSFETKAKDLEQICSDCSRNSQAASKSYRLNTLDLSSFESESLRTELMSIMSSVPDDLFTFSYDGFSFGNLCAFEVCIGMKCSRLDAANAEIRSAWLLLIESALKAYLLVREAIQKHRFTHVAYFNDYSLMLAAGLAAEKSGAVSRLICQASHRNVDRRRCVVFQKCTAANHFSIADRWLAWRDLPVAGGVIDEIAEDTFTRFLGVGSHLFSPPKTQSASAGAIVHREGLRVVAFTSSPDEWVGGFLMFHALGVTIAPPVLPFGSDMETYQSVWLKSVCEHIGHRSDMEFIIRIHPREGINKNENRASTHLAHLREHLRNLPRNCRVVWPEDPISSYDLAESADLVLTSWSTIGLEMARLGVPVLASTYGVSGFVADDFHEFSDTKEGYFQKLDHMIQRRPSLEDMKHAYRWWNLFCLQGSVDFSDVVPAPDFCGLPSFRMPARAEDFERAFLSEENIFDINNSRLKDEQRPDSNLAETLAIKKQCRRLTSYLLKDVAESSDVPLLYAEGEDITQKIKNLEALAFSLGANLLINRKRRVTLLSKGEWFEQYSPMAARLGFLGCTHACVDQDLATHLPALTEQVNLISNP